MGQLALRPVPPVGAGRCAILERRITIQRSDYVSVLRKIASATKRIFASPVPQLGELDYDAYWANRPVDDVHPRMPLIAKLVPPESRVVDIGCGDGTLLLELARTRGTDGFGVDISTYAVEHARKRGVECDVADVTDPRFEIRPGTQVVIISEVLEHIADPEAVLVRLREAGIRHVIVTVPNTGYLEHRVRLLFGRFPVQWLLHPGEHVRFWTVADFRVMASATGFDVRRVVPALGWFPFAKAWPSVFASQIIYDLRAPAAGTHAAAADAELDAA
jgi:methionine biosynthesis protein MetW